MLSKTKQLQFHHSPTGHVAKNGHRACHSSVRIPDRRGGTLDSRFAPVAPNQREVSPQRDGFVVLNRALKRIGSRYVRVPIAEAQYIGKPSPRRLVARPAGHSLGNSVEIRHVTPVVRADNAVGNAVERHSGALQLLHKPPLTRYRSPHQLFANEQRVTHCTVHRHFATLSSRRGNVCTPPHVTGSSRFAGPPRRLLEQIAVSPTPFRGGARGVGTLRFA